MKHFARRFIGRLTVFDVTRLTLKTGCMQLTNRDDHSKDGHRQVLTKDKILPSWAERRHKKLVVWENYEEEHKVRPKARYRMCKKQCER